MQPIRMSLRLLSGARIRPRPLTSKNVVCFGRHQCRAFGRSASLYERAAALPTEAREVASEDALAADQTNESPADTEQLWGQPSSDFVHVIRYTPAAKQADTESQADKEKVINVKYVNIDNPKTSWHPVYLRDMCTCSQCRDPSSTQKNFQTTDIPANIEAERVDVGEEGAIKITWKNDIPGFGPGHVSTFPRDFLYSHLTQQMLDDTHFQPPEPRVWHKKKISKELESIKYEDYIKDDEILHRALLFLNVHGLLLLKGVPESETAVEDIAGRMGKIRDTFYGRTWDVKSVPEAKNVAYTHQFLGLHMDLLYMADPPGFQLLHCLKNTCEGGSSIFSDSFQAAFQLPKNDYNQLCMSKLAYQYKNAGEHYYFTHPVMEATTRFIDTPLGWRKALKHVNYSPPFQADHTTTAEYQKMPFPQILRSLRKFAALVESPDNLYEYKMEEGDCVIFNNRRVLHGRRGFDADHGERWLKGAYVDTDVFMSRWRVLNEKYKKQGDEIYQTLEGYEARRSKTKKVVNYTSPFQTKAQRMKEQAAKKAEIGAQAEEETKAENEAAFETLVKKLDTEPPL